MVRGRHYGEYYDAPTNDGSVAYEPESEILFDVEAALTVADAWTVVAGAQNVFDQYPQRNPNGNVAGLVYPESSPFGFNGGFYYLRAIWDF